MGTIEGPGVAAHVYSNGQTFVDFRHLAPHDSVHVPPAEAWMPCAALDSPQLWSLNAAGRQELYEQWGAFSK